MRNHYCWTDEENKFLIEHYPGMKIRELVNILGRSFFSIHGHTRQLGLIGIKHELYGWFEDVN